MAVVELLDSESIYLEPLMVEVQLLDSRVVSLEPLAELYLLDSKVVSLEPLAEVYLLDSRTVTLEPLPEVGLYLLDSKTIMLEPLLPPCTPGQTRCIGPDLYECSPAGEWVLAEKDSPECAVEEKKFPWEWLLIGGGATIATIGLVATKKR